MPFPHPQYSITLVPCQSISKYISKFQQSAFRGKCWRLVGWFRPLSIRKAAVHTRDAELFALHTSSSYLCCAVWWVVCVEAEWIGIIRNNNNRIGDSYDSTADSNPVPSERGRVGITIIGAMKTVSQLLLLLSLSHCSWRGGSRTSASGGGEAASWRGRGTACCTRRPGPPCSSACPCAAPWPGADTSPGHSTSWGTPPAACSG